MGRLAKTSRACSAVILVVINCLLLAGGIFVVVASVDAKKSGWLEVVDSYWSGAHSILTGLEIVGGVIIGLAVLGSIAACCRWRAGLLIYSILIVLVLVAFVVVAALTFGLRGTANDWAAKSYPANSDEASIKPKFDRAYCYAQGAYICNDMGLDEAAETFFPAVANNSLVSAFDSLKGINAICDAVRPVISALGSVAPLESVCTACETAKDFENFTSVFEWANDKCPRTASTLVWCGTFLSNNDANTTVGTAPYSQCREPFLDLVSDSALKLGIGSVIVCFGALLIVIASCVLRRRKPDESNFEDTAYATPHANNAYHNAPQTNAPFYGAQPTTHHDNPYSRV